MSGTTSPLIPATAGSPTRIKPRHAATCAVVVTYGDRSALCAQVVEALLREGVGKIVLVDNGSDAASRDELECIAERNGARIDLLPLGENTGSAGGFRAGLSHVRSASTFEFVWLMDDDNVPLPGALDQLHSCRLAFNRSGHDHRLALLSLRERHPGLAAIARGAPPSTIYPPSSFLNFDIVTFPRKVLGRMNRRLNHVALRDTPVELPFGPYGGLLLSTQVLDEIGYPDERFFVYADDTEMTFRLHVVGGHIMLVPGSRVRDIDAPWDRVTGGGNGLSRLLLADSDSRVFYSVRNCVFFESRLWVRSQVRYRVNRFIFLSIASLAATCLRRRTRLSLILRAVRDGEQGRLGRTFNALKS